MAHTVTPGSTLYALHVLNGAGGYAKFPLRQFTPLRPAFGMGSTTYATKSWRLDFGLGHIPR